MQKLNIEVEYIDELLGTASANPELHEEFIASKAPDAQSIADEVASIGVEEAVNKAMTVFPRFEDGTPFTWDYQWKGYFKDCCGMLRRADGTKSKTLKAYKKEIDGLVFPEPRKIALKLPEGGEIGSCQRPLRASTAQGDRVALANSETVPAGTKQEFSIVVFRDALVPLILEWMEYGKYHGTGQWRNSGKGRFVCRVKDEAGKEIFSTM